MAKRATPKKQRSNAQSSQQFKAYVNRAQKRLMGVAHARATSHNFGTRASASDTDTGVSKIKA